MLSLCWLGCSNDPVISKQVIAGQTWTTYNITIHSTDEASSIIKSTVDSLLLAIDQSVSTYIDSSTISLYNHDNTYLDEALMDEHFHANHEMSINVFEQTNGSFDPTVKPLVDYYGFGNQKGLQVPIDSNRIDSMIQKVGFGKMLQPGINDINFQLDFSAIAKGYMVDQVALLLEANGYKDYLVEIGGEVKASGVNFEFNPWSLGIEQPLENSTHGQQIHAIIPLKNQSMATSGNYRNFKIIDGQKVVHTINPRTGYPEISKLLSATILTKDCAYADAYATACMVMGLDASSSWIESMKDVEGFLIYSNKDGELTSYASKGIRDKIIFPN